MSNSRQTKETSAMEKLGARVRQRALTGFEASTVGFALVACIGAGAGIGYLLDQFFETSYIVAIGTLLGAVLGFREMFRLASKLSRQSVADDAEAVRKSMAAAHSPAKSEPSSSAMSESTPTNEPGQKKPRLFAVPPPPTASFEKSAMSTPESTPPESTLAEEDETNEEFIERLLDTPEEPRKS